MRIIFLVALTSMLLAGCSSAPKTAYDQAIEARFAERDRHSNELRDRLTAFDRVLLDLDRGLAEYFGATLNSGFARADRLALGLEEFIRDRVDANFDHLIALADGASRSKIDPVTAGISKQMAVAMDAATAGLIRNQQIAMAALGFSGRSSSLDSLLNGAAHPNPKISGNAVLGLAILGDSRTPPEVIARVMENDSFPDAVRTSAAWSLFRLQTARAKHAAINKIWKRVLSGPIDENKLDGMLASALRGTGLSGDKIMSPEVVRYLGHPTPMVRMCAAISLGRLKDPSHVDALLTLIEPSEQNPNVRLAARKSLQALAGGHDRGYDIEAWRELFQRGL